MSKFPSVPQWFLLLIRNTIQQELKCLRVHPEKEGMRKRRKRHNSPSLAWMVMLSMCEDSISATQQLRSHRSKQSKWANPQREPLSTPLSIAFSPPLSLLHPSYFLLTHDSMCWLHFDAVSGGSLKCKMVNKCALMGNTFISLMPICPGRGAGFQRSGDIIGHHYSVAALSDVHMRRGGRFRSQTQTYEDHIRRNTFSKRLDNETYYTSLPTLKIMVQQVLRAARWDQRWREAKWLLWGQ